MQRECDSCRSAPAAFYCRADAAALCAACDADIHAANPISRRHHRVPVSVVHHCNYDVRDTDYVDQPDRQHSNNNYNYNYNYEALFGEEEVVVDYLQDLVELNSCTDVQDHQHHQKQIFDGRERVMKSEALSACVVPVQSLVLPKKNDDYHEMEYEVSNAGFSYSAPVVSQCVSFSSMDAGHIVPNNTDNPNSYDQPHKGTMELFSSPLLHMGQFSPMDREARVLRYREKKKNRKFEKTIRYASRKAYAEARPRIKGRFAKRTDVELEVDRMFSSYAVPEDSYGIVPSF